MYEIEEKNNRKKFLKLLAHSLPLIAKEAGQCILNFYKKEVDSFLKENFSPVTIADLQAEKLITKTLKRVFPDIPLVSEEGNWEHLLDLPSRFFLVDPLDGTKEFLKGLDEFTVNIALIESSLPIVGVVHVPALQETFWVDENRNALHEKKGKVSQISCRMPSLQKGLTVAVSRSHINIETTRFLEELPIHKTFSYGSSLKICRIAQGLVDIYPRFGQTKEWDTAAGHAILSSAGGDIWTLQSEKLTYGKSKFNNPFFIAMGKGNPKICLKKR